MFSFVFSIKGYTGGTCSNHSHFFLMEFRISQPSGGLASGRTCCAWRSDRLPRSEAGFLGRRRIYDCGPLSWNLATRWQRDPDCRMWRKRPLKLETQRTCKISELDDGWPESAEEHVTLVLLKREYKEYRKDMIRYVVSWRCIDHDSDDEQKEKLRWYVRFSADKRQKESARNRLRQTKTDRNRHRQTEIDRDPQKPPQ
jgi:hypothetical protein